MEYSSSELAHECFSSAPEEEEESANTDHEHASFSAGHGTEWQGEAAPTPCLERIGVLANAEHACAESEHA